MASRRVVVPKGEKTTLEKFLSRVLPNTTLARAAQLIDAGLVQVNGKKANRGRKTWGGESVDVEQREPAPAHAVEGPAIPVLHQSEHLIIVDKPSGLVVSPEPGQVSVTELLAAQQRDLSTAGTPLPGIVHRLDKETSGCLAFGRTDDGVEMLLAGFTQKLIDKRYLALVWGTPARSGSLDTPYAKSPQGLYTTKLASARRARLSWVVKRQFARAALVEVTLDTGRTHQIRVQFSELGHPVLGDRLYGAGAAGLAPRLALHAASLEIRLPNFSAIVESPVPPDFAGVESALAREALEG